MGGAKRFVGIAVVALVAAAIVATVVGISVHRSRAEAAKERTVKDWGVGACLEMPADFKPMVIEIQNVLDLVKTECSTAHAAEVLAIGKPGEPGCVKTAYPYIAAHTSLTTQALEVTKNIDVCLGEDDFIQTGGIKNDLVGSILDQDAERVASGS